MSTRLKNPAVINRFLKIPVVPGFLIALFMFRLADGVLGYIFPIVVEQELNSNLYMGLIMALSSITGLVCDFTFPTLISSKNWKQLLVVSILLALLFPLTTYLGQIFGLVIFFLLATIIWGIYFEFNIFSVQDYIIYQDKKRNFSKDWGLIGILVGMVEVVAPIIGASLLVISGPIYFAVVSIIFLIALYIGKSLDTDKSLDEVNKKVGKTKELIKLIKEVKMWELMAVRVWQCLLSCNQFLQHI